MPNTLEIDDRLAALAAKHGRDLLSALESSDMTVGERVATIRDSETIVRMANAGQAMLDAEIWFNGLHNTLLVQTELAPEMVERVLQASQAVQDRLQSLHAQFQAAAQRTDNPEVRRIGALACESAARLFDAAERLRWTLLERQADHDVDAGRVREFPSGQAAVAFLRSLHH